MHSALATNRYHKTWGTDDCVKASFIVSQDIAKNMKSFSDGDFLKDCFLHAAQCVSPPKSVNDFKRNCLSRNTIARRVEELSRNIESALQEKLRTCVFYSSAMNESTDQTSSYSSYELFVLRIMQENVYIGYIALALTLSLQVFSWAGATTTGRLLVPTTCLPHKDGGIPLSALPKHTTSKLAGLFSTLSLFC